MNNPSYSIESFVFSLSNVFEASKLSFVDVYSIQQYLKLCFDYIINNKITNKDTLWQTIQYARANMTILLPYSEIDYELSIQFIYDVILTFEKLTKLHVCNHLVIDKDDCIMKRNYFRKELFKHGWSAERIENYVMKRFGIQYDHLPYTMINEYMKILKCIDSITEKCHSFEDMNNFVYNICDGCVKNKKGRPTLPLSLKQVIIQDNKSKMKQSMNKKYEKLKILSESKITDDDLEFLKKLHIRIKNNDNFDNEICERFDLILLKIQKIVQL